jgi:signal transduction histidine kinase
MGAPGTRARRFLERLDVFLPANLDANVERWRVRLAIRLALVNAAVFAMMVVVQGASGSPAAQLTLVLVAALLSGPVILRLTGSYRLALTVVIASTSLGQTLGAIVVYGAGLNAATVGLAVIPLFATLLGGTRYGALWAALSIGGGVLVGALGSADLIAVQTRATLGIDHAALAAATAVSFLVGVLYELGHAQGLRDLAAVEAERRKAERDRLAAEAEAALARSERMAALGRMVATTAHEINNPLNFVLGNLELVREAVDAGVLDDDARQAMRDAVRGAERIGRIVADLKACMRPRQERADAVDVVYQLRTAVRMAEPFTRGRAAVRLAIGEPCAVIGSERLGQVFLNLIVNAAQAIAPGAADRNEIAISVERCGERVVVAIRDTGHGIPADVLARVKEPFFTTKKVGEGTGLGLAICDAIVKGVGGSLELESAASGTTARVELVATDEVPAANSGPVVLPRRDEPADRSRASA